MSDNRSAGRYTLHVKYGDTAWQTIKGKHRPVEVYFDAHLERVKALVSGVAFGVTTPRVMEFELRPNRKDRKSVYYRYDPALICAPYQCLTTLESGNRKAYIAILP